MDNLREKIAAEHKVRSLLDREGLPPPDRVEYGLTCVRLFWDGPRVALVVDLDELDGAPELDAEGAPGNAD